MEKPGWVADSSVTPNDQPQVWHQKMACQHKPSALEPVLPSGNHSPTPLREIPPIEFIGVPPALLQPDPEGNPSLMPDDMVGHCIGGQPCPPHVFADIDAEVAGGVSDEGFNG